MTEAPSYPHARRCPYQPPDEYRELKEGPPVRRVTLYDGRQTWLVTGHAEARALTSDPRVSADRRRDGFPVLAPMYEAFKHFPPTLLTTDPPEHNATRRIMLREFTVKRLKELTPAIERAVHQCLDELLAQDPPADLVAGFALPVPSLVISEMLGVPYADHELFQELSVRLVHADGPEQTLRASEELVAYLAGLVADPPPGMLARLSRDHLGAGGLSEVELLQNAALLLSAGHETTASMIAFSVVTLLEHPDQLDVFRSSPAAVSAGVDELLRFLSIIDSDPQRVATEDIEVAGQVIRAGEGFVVANGLVNRDPRAFEGDPDVLDVTRGSRHHLAFGYGVHQCLGQNLARVELEVALGALFERAPGLRLAVPVDSLAMRQPVPVHGMRELPVAW